MDVRPRIIRKNETRPTRRARPRRTGPATGDTRAPDPDPARGRELEHELGE